MPFKTTLDNLEDIAENISDLMEHLLLNYSSLYFWNTTLEFVFIISPDGNYAFRKLNQEGRQIQSRLSDEYRKFYSILTCLLRQQSEDSLNTLKREDEHIMSIIEQRITWHKDTREALNQSQKGLDIQLNLLKRLYDYSESNPTFVPDTKALLYNHILEDWKFPDTTRFTIALTPPVLEELNELKYNRIDDNIRNKAESLINQYNEYGRRGKITEGITLVNGASKLLSMASEPNMNEAMSWLDQNSKCDRFLASFIELTRIRPHSPVILVTRDINMQNNAKFNCVAFIEPPESIDRSDP